MSLDLTNRFDACCGRVGRRSNFLAGTRTDLTLNFMQDDWLTG